MAQEALGFMQNSKEKNLDFIKILSKEPDNILSLDVSSVKTLQIGYQAETLLLHLSLIHILDNPLIFPKMKILISIWRQRTEKRNNTISQMRLRSVFKMRISILNTATTEPVSYTHLDVYKRQPN